MQAHCLCNIHVDLSVPSLQNLGGQGELCKYAESHVACCAVTVISPLSLIQASGVFFPVKLWQTNLLLCN